MKSHPQTPWPDLAPGKHLVLDHYAVADTFRLKRVVHQVQCEPVELLTPLAPWEGTGPVPHHVVYEEESGQYRMWYSTLQFYATPGAHNGAPYDSQVSYAESADGVSWTRPDLRIYDECDGRNNICFRGASRACGTTIMRHPTSSRPASSHEYLMFNLDWFSPKSGGVCVARSKDGIRWQYDADNPKVFGHSDTTNSVVYNGERGVWMLYMRAWHSAAAGWIQNRNVRRRVAYSESADLENWSEPQIIITPDELDTNDFYGLIVFRYADYYLGQLQIFDEEGAETIDVELVWSKDGMHWTRLPQRQAFYSRRLPCGKEGFMVFPAQAPIVSGEEMVFYYAVNEYPHNSDCLKWHGSTHLLRGKLRLDGMVSLAAGRPLGALVTRPFVLQSDSISINAATHLGEIVAELVEPYHEKNSGDPKGKPIEGFGAQDFDVFRGDSTSHTLCWRGNSDLSALRGRRLMLRLSLYCAEIYSFTI